MSKHEKQAKRIQFGGRTEKTMRKNGQKWSNISVKKYHHNPGFGVKSGRVKLSRFHNGHLNFVVKTKPGSPRFTHRSRVSPDHD